jgi:hypothetical protein
LRDKHRNRKLIHYPPFGNSQFEIVRSTGYAVLMEPPIACTLTEIEMQGRRRTILDSVRGATLTVTPLPLGYAYRFEPTSEVLAQLTRLVDLERQCCPFLTFGIIIEAGNLPIRLEITGPPEAKAVIADFFGS